MGSLWDLQILLGRWLPHALHFKLKPGGWVRRGGGGRQEGGWPGLQAGGTAGAQQKADVSSSHWKHPQHTGPRADSDLPQNQPSGMSLTSWPGQSVTRRPPRRIVRPVSSALSARSRGLAARHSCAPAASLPSASLEPRSATRSGQSGSWQVRAALGTRAARADGGPRCPELGLGRRRVSGQL